MSTQEFDDPSRDNVEKWLYGTLGPLAAACVGIAIIHRGHFSIPTRAGHVEFHGIDAAAWGMVLLAVAAAIHCHFFWRNSNALAMYSDLGKIIAVVVLVVCVGFLAGRLFA